MKKFLRYIQNSYGYSDYEIEVIEYFFLTIASELSKMFIIFAFFIYIGEFTECLIALAALLFFRLTAGGYHCEHYITCFLMSFSFIYGSIFFAEHLLMPRIAIILIMILCIVIGYKLAPIISTHRLEPSEQLIRRSHRLNLFFLFISLLAVSMFYTTHYILIIFWVCVLHSIQLLLTKFQKGGKYYVTQFIKSCF